MHPRPMLHRAAAPAVALALLAAPAAAQELTLEDVIIQPRAVRLAATASCPSLPLIPAMSAANGVTLTMAPGSFRIGTTPYQRNIYNGRYNAPTLRIDPGQRLRVNVVNQMRPIVSGTDTIQSQEQVSTTNQHYHGMVVTPLPTTGDNVLIEIPQGRSNLNDFAVPDTQAQGFMWYHPHPHGKTSTQVQGGLAGALIVGNLLKAYFPQYEGARERLMIIKDTSPPNADSTYLNINGNPCTTLTIAPNEQQFWRIGNMAANTFVNLKLDGYTFTVLAWDGNRVTRPTQMDSLFVPPGSRVEVIVTGRAGAPPAKLYSAPFRQATTGGLSPRVELGTLVTTRAPAAAPKAQPLGHDAPLSDSIQRLLADIDVDTFTVRFGWTPDSSNLALNDSAYDRWRLDRAVAVGRTQEWTLVNATTFLHTFHIHQTDFVVTEINGVPQPARMHRDNIELGLHERNGQVVGDTVKIRFTFHPVAAGPFVYHCHVLAHEDFGMMANICVYDPAKGESPETCKRNWYTPPAGGGGHAGH